MLRYSLTIFLSAFLLFQVQPLISKFILPWFGGTPAVWTTCMVFFQMLLLGGYTYAHLVATRLSYRRQAIVHLVVLAVAILTLPIAPSANWKPSGSENPTWHILLLLAVSVGLPYFVLATTSPLLQAWFSRTHPGRRTYRLYSLSNVGSLLALLSFPFLIEPRLASPAQALVWSVGFVVFALLCAVCAARVWDLAPLPEAVTAALATPEDLADVRPTWGRRVMWLALPACGSVMLLAVTNQMCQDVAVIPFLWVVPLSLYLLSFVICFDNEAWYIRPIFWLWLVGSMVSMVALLDQGVDASLTYQVAGFSLGLFGCCMVCHGELVRLKPSPRYLTSFYLMVSAGGALGGVFVSLIAPRIFPAFFELHVGMWASCALAMVAFWMDKRPHRYWPASWLRRVGFQAYLLAPFVVLVFGYLQVDDVEDALVTPQWIFGVWGLAGAIGVAVWLWLRRKPAVTWRWSWLSVLVLPAFLSGLLVLAVKLHEQAEWTLVGSEHISRNFYGVLRVTEYGADDPDRHRMVLRHGRITHGCQLVDEAHCTEPTTYYWEESGIGLTLQNHPRRDQGLHVGAIGLGVGTIAAYGQPLDRYRFYEINPQVRYLATHTFTYLTNTEAKWSVVMGDARLSLERELQRGEAQQFDVLIVDAFSGDAIPVHLLTREAFDIYRQHMREGGVIAVHISNRYLDLEPVVWAMADHIGFDSVVIDTTGDDEREVDSCTWVLVTNNQALLQTTAIDEAKSEVKPEERKTLLWTDAYSDMFRILK